MLSIHFRTMIGGMSGNDLVTIRRFTVTPCRLFVPVRAVSGANYRQKIVARYPSKRSRVAIFRNTHSSDAALREPPDPEIGDETLSGIAGTFPGERKRLRVKRCDGTAKNKMKTGMG